MSKNSICVVIPVHKPAITTDEAASLQACSKILQYFDCFLLFPEAMDTKRYTAFHETLILKPVPATWLSSIERYNKMKVSIDFYNMFDEYQFMLTYELDAYIFNADFHKCNAFSFDFIGSPFFEDYLLAKSDAPFIPGCNSGFSIRNIHSCIDALNRMHKYKHHWLLYKHVLSKFPRVMYHFNQITNKRYDVFINGQTGFYFSDMHFNEDIVWSKIVPKLFSSFKVADPLTAAKFSFEANPARLLQLNNGQLPIGCHAWPKFKDFWKDYIKINEL